MFLFVSLFFGATCLTLHNITGKHVPTMLFVEASKAGSPYTVMSYIYQNIWRATLLAEKQPCYAVLLVLLSPEQLIGLLPRLTTGHLNKRFLHRQYSICRQKPMIQKQGNASSSLKYYLEKKGNNTRPCMVVNY